MTMERRRRLNMGDEALKRADELKAGDRFLDVLPWWTDRSGDIVIRQVRSTRLLNDDVEIRTCCGQEITTSIGNTFLVMPSSQHVIGQMADVTNQ